MIHTATGSISTVGAPQGPLAETLTYVCTHKPQPKDAPATLPPAGDTVESVAQSHCRLAAFLGRGNITVPPSATAPPPRVARPHLPEPVIASFRSNPSTREGGVGGLKACRFFQAAVPCRSQHPPHSPLPVALSLRLCR